MLQVGVAQQRQKLRHLLRQKVPPAKLQQKPGQLCVKAVLEQPCGIAAHDGVRVYVPRHNGISRNNGAVTDFYARHDGAFPPQPYIAAHNGIALEWELGQVRRRTFSPCAAEYIEWVSGDAAHPVVRAAHNEARAARNAAELRDDESVAEFGPVEQHVVLFKIRRCSGVVVISIIADKDVGGGDHVF